MEHFEGSELKWQVIQLEKIHEEVNMKKMNEAIGDLNAKRVSLVAKPTVDNSKKDQDAAKKVHRKVLFCVF